jgi:UDP-N-acetylmuramate-alanine ligase
MADVSIITAFWRGREAHVDIPNVARDIQDFGSGNIKYIPDENAVVDAVADLTAAGEKSLVLVLGAGRSWKIAEKIKERLSG